MGCCFSICKSNDLQNTMNRTNTTFKKDEMSVDDLTTNNDIILDVIVDNIEHTKISSYPGVDEESISINVINKNDVTKSKISKSVSVNSNITDTDTDFEMIYDDKLEFA
jgi:hypothetical protein